MSDGEQDSGSQSIPELADYFSQYYEVFALMGIFGTVAVFLSQFRQEQTSNIFSIIGLGGSLIIFSIAVFILSLDVLSKLLENAGTTGVATEFIYSALLIGLLSLGASVVGTLVEFDSAIETFFPLLSGVLLVVSYINFYPIERFNQRGVEDPGAVAAILFSFCLPVYSSSITSTAESLLVIFEFDTQVLVAPVRLGTLILFHYVISLVFLKTYPVWKSVTMGTTLLTRKAMGNLVSIIKARTAWYRNLSVLFAFAGYLLFAFVLSEKMSDLSSNTGYYEFFGYRQGELLLGLLVLSAIIFTLHERATLPDSGSVNRAPGLLAFAFGLVEVALCVLVWYGGFATRVVAF